MDLKSTLRAITLELRREFEGKYDAQGNWQPGDLERRLASIGVRRDRLPVPVDELTLSADDREARRVVDAFLQSRAEAGEGREAAIAEFVREAAYSWANRLLALRCMEARGLIDEVILQKEAYGGRSLQHQRLARKEPERCSGEDEGLLAVVFDEFARRAKELPLLFDPRATEVALRPSVAALKRCIALLSGTLAAKGQDAATDEVFTAPDALGWTYQYWNTEEKDRVFEKVRTKKGAKIEGAEIVPATCIYTEPYMVRFLVQNSLGAMWMGMNPGSRLCEGWQYYVRDADRAPVSQKAVSEITFLDPACGSGHFLIEAFELFYAMYLEEGAITDPAKICASILERNLYGIDIDERAVQIAALALVMKTKEKAPDFVPHRVNLVATNIRLPAGKDHIDAFLAKHPDDIPLKPALLAIFEGLAHADELGSLLQIEEPVERELRNLRDQQLARERKAGAGTLFGPRKDDEWSAWKHEVIGRLRQHFSAEAQEADLAAAFFGEAASKGLSLVDLLATRYDVVAANPPYMGSKNMGPGVKRHIERHFSAGKRDLYAAFILRCLQLARESGRVAMVTQQAWLFLHTFSELRLPTGSDTERFSGILGATTIETLDHLGPRAFSEIGGEVVSTVMFVLAKAVPKNGHRLSAIRTTHEVDPAHKDAATRSAASSGSDWRPLQDAFKSLPGASLAYWLHSEVLELLKRPDRFSGVLKTRQGVVTGNNDRFLRYHWETSPDGDWRLYMKGLGFRRWYGFTELSIQWSHARPRISQFKVGRVKQESDFQQDGWTYSSMAQGSMSPREYKAGWIYDNRGPVVFPKAEDSSLVASILASRFGSLLLRSQTQGNDFNSYHVDSLPLWINRPDAALDDAIAWLVRAAKWTSSADIVDRQFDVSRLRVQGSFRESLLRRALEEEPVLAAQLTVEAFLERAVFDAYAVSTALQSVTFSELGFPAGWYPLVAGYDSVPELPQDVGCPSGLDVLLAKTSKQDVAVKDLSGIRSRLRELYAAGAQRGNSEDTAAPVDDVDADTEDDDAALGAAGQAPMPAETFFEEMARALECHPVSICWLLRELRDGEGLVSKAELVRFTEGYVSVLVLRLLGHRWPREIEAGEPPPTWVDGDGIIALTDGPGGKRLLARVRDRFAEDFGRDRVGAIEREFEEIVGRPLGAWLASDFFRRHISQFRKRPIALQIVSSGGNNERRRGRGAGQNTPAFSCLVYYHRLDADLLPKLRTQYVGPLRTSLQTELGSLEKIKERSADQDARRLELEEKLDELKAFAARLEQVIVEGLASAALDRVVAKEPLDKWTSRDGRARPPDTRDAFIAQERRYDLDLNDGVRVNIAPLQRAGLLAADVLTAKNVEKAIADRAEWRADERRWCREGKLPRPGWWLEDVAEVKTYGAHNKGTMASTEGTT
jgi:SAM-dependent methyltransferase